MLKTGPVRLLFGLLLLASFACNFGGGAIDSTPGIDAREEFPATEAPPPPTGTSSPTDTPAPTETLSPTETPTPAGPKDCGDSLDCMIEAAETCNPAIAMVVTPIDLFGLIVTTTSTYQIQGTEGKDCVFYLKTEGQQVDFSPEFMQQLLDNGVTEEEIELQKQEANRQAETVVGLDGTCHFAHADDLVAVLVRWQQGSFSTDDWSVAECEGAMFPQ